MKRLTKRWGDDQPRIAGRAICMFAECPSAAVCDICNHAHINNRLAAIEDILGDEYDLDELREMIEAKREGRCVVLPAKTVFELVWSAGEGCNLACPVSIDGKGCCDLCDYGTLLIEEVPCKQEHIERIGADVFLTHEEAEQALRREQDSYD